MDDDTWEAAATRQGGALSRQQALKFGLTESAIKHRLARGWWRRADLPGVYLTFTGPVPEATRLWVAVLYGGPGAALSGRTALWVHGVADPPERLEVSVPFDRRSRVRSTQTLRVRNRRELYRMVASSGDGPPHLLLDVAVLDVADETYRPDDVVGLVTRVTQRRLTTAARLVAELAERERHKWRALLGDVLVDVVHGVASPLERHWLRSVVLAHGLPRPLLNAEDRWTGRRRYRDGRFDEWGVVVELDGRAAHPDEARDVDRSRDNEIVVRGTRTVLRYGWTQVVGDPCGAAAQTAEALTARGWTGRLTPCGPGCTADRRRFWAR